MNKIEVQIQKAEEKFAQHKARLQKLKNRQQESAKKELHKKHLIIGQLIMTKMKGNKLYSEKVLTELDCFLTKSSERALFQLQSVGTDQNNKVTTRNIEKSRLIKHD